MATRHEITDVKVEKARISMLWVVVMLNMLFADALTLYIPESLQKVLSGSTPADITPAMMLVMAVIIEIPIAMIFLSRVLKDRVNRWVNTATAAITIVSVVGFSTCSNKLVDGPALWRVQVENDLITEWQVLEDTEDNRKLLKL